MLISTVTIAIAALAFAAFALAGSLAAHAYFAGPPLPGAPPAREAPVVVLVCVTALLGALCAYRATPIQTTALIAAVCAILVAIWVVDVARGIIPDALTLMPLGALIVAGLLIGHWYVLVAAAAPALPFAFMAWRTKGLGMGWGDVKLAALGGALLGLQDAILAFAIATAIAIAVNRIRRADKMQPIAFAPYLASAIAIPLCLHTTVV